MSRQPTLGRSLRWIQNRPPPGPFVSISSPSPQPRHGCQASPAAAVNPDPSRMLKFDLRLSANTHTTSLSELNIAETFYYRSNERALLVVISFESPFIFQRDMNSIVAGLRTHMCYANHSCIIIVSHRSA